MSAQLSGTSPNFLVADVVRAAEYYRDALGFAFERYWGEPPCFAIVWRDRSQIMLRQAPSGTEPQPNRALDPEAWDAYIYVNDADAYHAELAAKGADILSAPTNQPHGCREFVVRDPDGHALCFGQDLEV